MQIICGAAFQPLRRTLLTELRVDIEAANADGREPGFLYLCASPLVADAVTRDLLEGMPGWQGRPVMLFGSLATRILDGTDVPTLIPPHARQPLLEMVLERQAAAGQLMSFGRLVAAPGFAQGVAGLLSEFKQASVRPATLRQALAEAASGRGDGSGAGGADTSARRALGPREQQLAGLYEAYQEALAQAGWIDPEDLLLLALSHLAETNGAFFSGYRRLVVEGFHQFTPAQEAVLQVAAACVPDVTVLLPFDPDVPGPFSLAQATAERLQALGGPGTEIIGAEVPAVTVPGALQHLAANWRRPAEPVVAGGAIACLPAASPEDERIITVQRLRHLLRHEPGWRPSDVMIVWRDGLAGAAPWQQALAGAGIPCQHIAGEPLTSVPAVRAALLALRLASRPTVSARELLELLKTGYAGVTDWQALADAEEAVARIGGHLPVRDWLQRTRARRQACWRRLQQADQEPELSGIERARLQHEAALLARAEQALKPLAGIVQAVAAEAPPERLAEQVRGIWLQLGLQATAMAALDAPELTADETVTFAAQDLAGLELLDQLLANVVAGYRAGLGSDTATVPATRFVQGVLAAAQAEHIPARFGDPDGVRLCSAPLAAAAEPARLVIVTGLNDGEFPKRHRPDWLLREGSRLALREVGIRLETGRERLADEEFLFYQTVTRATERLWLTWTASERDEALLPSAYVEDVQRLFAAGSIPDLGDGPLAPRPADVLALGWGGAVLAPGADLAAALRERARTEGRWTDDLDWRAAAEAERQGAAFGRYDGFLGGEAGQLTAQLLGTDHGWSASQLADYATCPFRFFSRVVLRLGEIDEAGDELAPHSIGTLYHEALYEFFSEHLGERLDPAQLPELKRKLRDIIWRVCDRAAAHGAVVHELLWPSYREEMVRRLTYFLEREVKRLGLGSGELVPVRLESDFDLPPGTLPGLDVRLVGRIDRIDQAPDGRFVLYDYKLSRVPSIKDVRAGLEPQLPLYVEVAEALLAGGGTATAAGAGYIGLRKAEVGGVFPSGAKDLHGRRTGLGDEEWADLREQAVLQVKAQTEAARAGDFRVAPRRCPARCSYRRVCRIDRDRIGRKQVAEGWRLLEEEAEA